MLQTGRNSPHAYHSTAHGIRSIFATEGLKGFWRGLVPSLFGNSHGAVQFAAYEQLKNHRRNAKAKLLGAPARKAGEEVELSNWDYLLLSGSSKIFAGSITYPYQVVRARLQTYEAGKVYKGAWDAVVQIWRKEALRGFYKG
jgi:solute carrier family 25 folate transporter 32